MFIHVYLEQIYSNHLVLKDCTYSFDPWCVFFIVVLKEARKYRVIGLKVTGTLMLNFINPKSATFSLGQVMHDK